MCNLIERNWYNIHTQIACTQTIAWIDAQGGGHRRKLTIPEYPVLEKHRLLGFSVDDTIDPYEKARVACSIDKKKRIMVLKRTSLLSILLRRQQKTSPIRHPTAICLSCARSVWVLKRSLVFLPSRDIFVVRLRIEVTVVPKHANNTISPTSFCDKSPWSIYAPECTSALVADARQILRDIFICSGYS